MSLIVAEILSQLSLEDERTLISLPYRAGLYVSFSDVTGGWEAQEKEIQSLTSILRQFSEDFFKTEFTQKVLMETLAARINWLEWSRHIENLPEQVEKMVGVLAGLMEEEELNAFSSVIIDIALAVAMAFQEHGPEGGAVDKQEPPLSLKDRIARMIGAQKGSSPLSHVNISPSEKEALLKLAESLGYEGLGG